MPAPKYIEPGVSVTAFELLSTCACGCGKNSKPTIVLIKDDALEVFNRLNKDWKERSTIYYNPIGRYETIDRIEDTGVGGTFCAPVNYDHCTLEELVTRGHLRKLEDTSVSAQVGTPTTA